ncbi:targeting protein for isoform 1 [Plasmopara halstedii]|uniref:Targeting protein for isoform 1 n=1 Tax=Plasmopara halstedii TaxID=4781 RepID=A0A0P1ALV3_PLAHL|nr:targeting protein for isoform 1 [Plasmopara halstedii]CEG42135.1 targeting protein for isoform 1 [Plasmopara halstedii]|eukprot:XP_024578504.1 targeting protein for isoform 1 [Plasmopara halstedii]
MATLLDTTMEALEPEAHTDNNLRVPQSVEPETDAPEDEDDDDEDFNFDAPVYYDLKNPSFEQCYVNNADGYFSPTKKSSANSKESFNKVEKTCVSKPSAAVAFNKKYDYAGNTKMNGGNQDAIIIDKTILDTTMVDAETVETVLNTSNLLDDRDESFEEVFRHYASSSQSSATSSYLLHDLDTSTHSSTHNSRYSSYGSATYSNGGTSSGSSPVLSSSAATRTGSGSAYNGELAETRFRAADTIVSSKLMQPTQSYLRRVQAEQKMREQIYMEDISVDEKPPRVTQPKSPKLHTKTRQTNSNDSSRMSSTSRELLKIQEERLLLQLEKLKIREFHEKTKVQRPPTNVHQRSTKQLTIPQTPHFEVDNRIRRLKNKSGASDFGHDQVQPPLAAEKLLTRDFSLSLPSHRENRHTVTTPQSPHLRTASRAAHRPPPAPLSRKQEKPAISSNTHPTNGGLTQPMTPQLETSRRAATHHRPIKFVDHDAEELAKKFHARPLSKSILEPKFYSNYSPAKTDTKSRSTQPTAVTASRSSATVSAAEVDRRCKIREQRLKLDQRGPTVQPKSVPRPVRQPVIPETPPLKSIQLHREYQENFRRKIEAEKKETERQRQFKANPIRVVSKPVQFEGSTKPLTEVKPFQLPGERYVDQARARLEQKRLEEEERLKSLCTFRAKPMPVFESDSVQIVASNKPLTQTESPMLATKSRAAERAAFEAAEKERREREEAFRLQQEEQERQQKEEEIKHLRRKEMIFHARPVPESNITSSSGILTDSA